MDGSPLGSSAFADQLRAAEAAYALQIQFHRLLLERLKGDNQEGPPRPIDVSCVVGQPVSD